MSELTFEVQIAGGVRPLVTMRTVLGPVVRIVGQPGTGKTTLREALARDLSLESLDISDMPGHLERPSEAWHALGRFLGAQTIVVESAGTSKWERGFWHGRRSLSIRCNAPDAVRAERLATRREAEEEIGYVNRLLSFRAPGDWDFSWDGTAEIGSESYVKLKEAIGTWLARVALVNA